MDVIPLSRFRALLARARSPKKRVEAILAEPRPGELVASLPAQEVFYLVRELGLRDAGELLALCTPAQLRTFVDLDAWDRDNVDPARFFEWLEALLDLGAQHAAALTRALDAELASLLLAQHAQVHDLSLEEGPAEDTEHPLYPTPDRFFLVEITAEDPERARLIERWIDALYVADMDLARRVLMGARWELPSELEEHSYRWRSGRMADLGFIEYYEALEVYRFLDPASVAVGEHSAVAAAADEEVPAPTLPVPYVDPLDRESFLSRVLGSIADEGELRRLESAITLLINRVLSADRVPVGDLDATRAVAARAVDTLGLGLEFVAKGDPDQAAVALRDVALVRLFRAGFSLTLQLRRLAETLVARGRLGPAPGTLAWLDGAQLRVVQGLLEPRPQLARELDRPPAAGFRPFQTRDDIGRGARALEELAFLGALLVDRLRWVEPGGPHTFASAVRDRLAAAGGDLDLLERGLAERLPAPAPPFLRSLLERLVEPDLHVS